MTESKKFPIPSAAREDLEEAYNGMERLEHTCLILKTAHELGGITSLPPEEIEVLRGMRLKMGNRSL
jgi:L-fuculose-phosphate aldolase